MSNQTLKSLKQAMTDAGFEIYRVEDHGIRIAQRVRMHLMESGVIVSCEHGLRTSLTVRGQRSDFPSASADELFERIRGEVTPAMSARGFDELAASTRRINNPADDAELLDVWFEITFVRDAAEMAGVIDDVHWALAVPKCIDP